MPYQGDSHPAHARFTTDCSYLFKLPGAFILVQNICCTFAFLLAISGAMKWRVGRGHGFFVFVAFLSMLSCDVWLAVRVLRLDSMFKKKLNWNIAGLVHNGINALFMMVASCVLLEAASEARPLRAAGVFGFLGFSAFLAGLIWEAIIWRTKRDSETEFQTATVIRGVEREPSQDSEGSIGVAATEDEESVSFVGIKPRPVSSFLEQQSGNTTQVSTPMLMVPQDDKENSNSHRSSSSASSTQGEWQMASAVST
ncbi:CKLF-like MARVEL transmembrane domain-containing protein 4 [Portunus trituberculatus]|uniref:CKLF-like MARVEL transmembrane domain-containing protein 4 n=1 Tax=Portunus trituberculatus TaxID=210409 RepID=UPI001E1CBDE1|nr:CKLF-like MARVEL transmembrane domain-containing protein 4 [Portunus trituberculatus]XP_045109246.1 CKLF-like MARVEL transmembrane domain-containing protein 4 [Portunus trituberculatus]XP_045109247.1 CKLF-like MARVEL transmembrane domain-containing protein 4 [Portunus trituberculatus]